MQDRKFEPVQLVSNRDSAVHSMAGSAFLSHAFTNGENLVTPIGLTTRLQSVVLPKGVI